MNDRCRFFLRLLHAHFFIDFSYPSMRSFDGFVINALLIILIISIFRIMIEISTIVAITAFRYICPELLRPRHGGLHDCRAALFVILLVMSAVLGRMGTSHRHAPTHGRCL